MFKHTIGLMVLLSATLSYANEQSALDQEAVDLIKPFAAQLQSTLQGAIAEGGVVNGISVCNLKATAIAERASTEGWTVGRTSLKVRNADNAPDEWERTALTSFETRALAGESADTLTASAVIDGEFRFMKAIPTGALCLQCHGANMATDTTEALDRLYPNDLARGYDLGDIRGAFTLKKSMP